MPDNPHNAKRHKTRPRDSAGPQLARRAEAEARARTAEELLHELRAHQIELESQNDELRRAQVALEIARDRYLDLFDFAPVGYLTVNHDGLIVEANLTAAAMLGEDRKKLLQHQFVRFVAAADSDHWRRHFMSLQRETDRRRIELLLQSGTNAFFPAQLDCQPIAVRGEESVVRMALTDISALKSAQDELRVAATAFESQEAILITDAEQRIVRVNRTFIEETGYTAEEAVGKSPPQLLRSGREPPEFYDVMDKQIARTGIWQGEI